MKRTKIAAGIIIVLALAAIGGAAYHWQMQKKAANEALLGGQPLLPEETITVGTTTVLAEVARTDAEQKTGLSYRASLAQDRGMLFIFARDSTWGIWMPDMRFSIDILWADAGGKILTIAADVSPQTYPKIFYPSAPARYVLELPAGFAAAHGISAGDTLSLPV